MNSRPEQSAEHIPDHELVRCIGRGSYGYVWLARNVVGTYRAIKIINRKSFPADRPFEREFTGITKFEPISRTHPNFVSVLHIGRNHAEGYFYYVMEIGDDETEAQSIHPETYRPKTLASELVKHGRLPAQDCVRIATSLTNALSYLHQQGLVHRDVKPSNIIFVNGAPKFADIGLVADIGEAATFVGTEGYVPPEGPGRPTADIYSMGKLLYEISMGKPLRDFPELPTDLDRRTDATALRKLYEIILKACELNTRKRFPSASEMLEHLSKVFSTPTEQTAAVAAAPPVSLQSLHVAILYQPGTQPGDRLATMLQEALVQRGGHVFLDKRVTIDVEWARSIEDQITRSAAVVVLLSHGSANSEMIAYEVELAHQAAHQQSGKPRLLPVRMQFAEPLPSQLASALDQLPHFTWDGDQHNAALIEQLAGAIAGRPSAVPRPPPQLEPVGGAVPLDSNFYVVRRADEEFESAIARGDSIVLVKGGRQMGKTSLLARGLQRARQEGARVVLTDFQKLHTADFESIEKFFFALGESLADQLDLDVFLNDTWDPRRGPNTNFERYLRREALEKIASPVVWGLDEVDRLFGCPFGTEIFGLFRSWHNKRALEPSGPWAKLTLAIAYATEANLFITDVVQSPFNIGTRVVLEDFLPEQIGELNVRHGSPLKTQGEVERLFNLLAGQPFLIRRGLHELAAQSIPLAAFESQADNDEGIFGDHLRRLLLLLAKDPELTEIVKGVLQGQPCSSSTRFFGLRSAGILTGENPSRARLRCGLYERFLKRRLT